MNVGLIFFWVFMWFMVSVNISGIVVIALGFVYFVKYLHKKMRERLK